VPKEQPQEGEEQQHPLFFRKIATKIGRRDVTSLISIEEGKLNQNKYKGWLDRTHCVGIDYIKFPAITRDDFFRETGEKNSHPIFKKSVSPQPDLTERLLVKGMIKKYTLKYKNEQILCVGNFENVRILRFRLNCKLRSHYCLDTCIIKIFVVQEIFAQDENSPFE